jgi:hypothetical protein
VFSKNTLSKRIKTQEKFVNTSDVHAMGINLFQ